MSLVLPTNHNISETNPTNRIGSTNELEQDVTQSLFSPEELCQFAEDDITAGRRIGKILSALFIYTLAAMGVAIWWTLRTVGH